MVGKLDMKLLSPIDTMLESFVYYLPSSSGTIYYIIIAYNSVADRHDYIVRWCSGVASNWCILLGSFEK